jgi:multidrug efflux pump subunit AcrB
MISFFAKRHLLGNVIFLGILFMGAFAWHSIGKEEMPEFASNWVRVNTVYPGAPAGDVELFITKPMEDELKSVVGIEEITTTSSLGISTFRITIDDNYPNKDEVVQDIQDAVLRVKLPAQVRNLPRIRQFKSSEKAILDIGLYHKKKKVLDSKSREELQKFVMSFENQLLSMKEISSIQRSHYLKPELQILVNPKEILNKEISISQIKSQIISNNIRAPIGSLHDKGESKVTALNELESVETLSALLLEGNYEGQGIKLGDIANIGKGYEKSTSIFKVNGHEAIFLNIKKSISTDILTAQRAVSGYIKKFKETNIDAPIDIVLMDDESYAVRNRLDIIGTNGILGFFLIVIVLFIFLDIKSGFWVAMGIPFSMSLTLIIAHLIGYTVNNMTLAGIIIVLGIVVDDAIIIAENISRHREQGKPLTQAAIDGTTEVFRPILASIITTCIAFIPLMFFDGFFGKLVTYIPLIVILMLLGSLIESLFVLPSHMSGRTILLDRFVKKQDSHWFHRIEKMYKAFILKLFNYRIPLLIFFTVILVGAVGLFQTKMKFVMFPREESTEVFIKVKAPAISTREETSKLIEPLEDFLASDAANVVGVRSSVALSRRGGGIRENEASILVEVFPADERKIPLSELITKWEGFSQQMKGLKSIKFQKGRWGHGSGNAIEIQIQENNDNKRDSITSFLEKKMKDMPQLKDVEIEEPLKKKEYILKLNQLKMTRYNITPSNVTTVLRTFVEGSILYSINKGDEEVDVRLSVPESNKESLKELLNLRVENKEGHLVYLKNIVEIKEVIRPVNITRNNFKRSTMIFANMAPKTQSTPLEVASIIEEKLFSKIVNLYPTAVIKFKGEVEDSRESQGEFGNSILIVVVLIYMVLVIMFNSLIRPLLILIIVPFGIAGSIYVLFIHGMSVYGFFAVIGSLGMIGVVINDAIVMVDKIDNSMRAESKHPWEVIASVASSRLRPILLTTITTLVGILPTAYGFAGYDSMLAEMMLTMGWGVGFGTLITLLLIPTLYTFQYKKQDT